MSKKHVKVKKLEGTPYVIDQQHVIDKGSFAKIVKAYNTQNLKQELVAKVISCTDQETCQTIKAQLNMLKKLPYNLNLVNCVKIQISSEKNFYMIMQYCNEGNLAKYLYRKKNQMSQQRIWFFLKQFCQGYKVLYDAKIIHRDLKPENILIHNGNFKIADFGLARFIQSAQVLENLSSKGTPLFMAPQLGLSREGNAKVDVFSLGIILYKMAFNGKHPYFQQGRSYKTVKDYFNQVKMKKLIFPQGHNRSAQLVNLVTKMLEKENQVRISWKQIFDIDRIKQAVRYQRRTQILPMDQFTQSLVIGNRSITNVQVIDQQKQYQQRDKQDDKETAHLVIQQTFNRSNKTKIEQKLYHHKLLYTLIEHTNKKIIRFLNEIARMQKQLRNNKKDNQSLKVFQYMRKVFIRLVTQGFKFSLFLIKNLETISGNWADLNHGQIMNFEDIFDSDKDIILNQLKSFFVSCKQLRQSKTEEQIGKIIDKGYIHGEYENSLYQLLSEYEQFPEQIKQKIRVMIMLLIDIYDLVIKYEQKHVQDQDKSKIEIIEQENVDQFRNYLIKVEYVKQTDIKRQLKAKGLLFL